MMSVDGLIRNKLFDVGLEFMLAGRRYRVLEDPPVVIGGVVYVPVKLLKDVRWDACDYFLLVNQSDLVETPYGLNRFGGQGDACVF